MNSDLFEQNNDDKQKMGCFFSANDKWKLNNDKKNTFNQKQLRRTHK